MRKSRKTVSARVDAEDYKYLQLLALSTEQTISGAISTAIKKLEQTKPITFSIFKIIHHDGSEAYDVILPYGGYIICGADSLEDALQAITAFRNKQGYTDERRFKLEKEITLMDLRFEVDTGNGIMGLV
jgi:hypothetical protein